MITSLVIEKYEAVNDNTQIRICVKKTEIFVNKTENRITFKIRTSLELWTSEIMKLLGSGNNKITKISGENIPHVEITEVVLFCWNIVINEYHQNSRVLYTFTPKKSIQGFYLLKYGLQIKILNY